MRMLTMAGALAMAAGASADSIVGLGVPAGWTATWATGMSADGAVVVGSAVDAGGRYHAWRWTAAGGMVELVPLVPGALSWALGVSADGAIAVGQSADASGQARAVRWTGIGPGAVQDLGLLPGAPGGTAIAANASGTIVIGNSGGSFRWIALQGVENFQAVSGMRAIGISGNGGVYAGVAGSRAVVWSQPTGLVDLGMPLEVFQSSEARLVSDDGRVVVGVRTDVVIPYAFTRAFRWTPEGISWLGMTHAEAMTPSGSIVVGATADEPVSPNPPLPDVARMWTESLGWMDVRGYLESRGMNLSGWRLDRAVGISADGRVLAGVGERLVGGQWRQEAWRVALDTPIPGCYANCDLSTVAPVLNVADFSCFLNRFAGGDTRANCDGSSMAPVLNVADFVCFLNRFAEGCE